VGAERRARPRKLAKTLRLVPRGVQEWRARHERTGDVSLFAVIVIIIVVVALIAAGDRDVTAVVHELFQLFADFEER
jgi:hypothetical protein